jgi:hypothetical protein
MLFSQNEICNQVLKMSLLWGCHINESAYSAIYFQFLQTMIICLTNRVKPILSCHAMRASFNNTM